MVDFLVLGGFLEVLGLGLTSPHNVPFRAVGANDAETSRLQRVDNGVINMCCLANFETKHHIMLLKIVLAGYLDFLELAKMRLGCPAISLQERGALLHARGSVPVVHLSWS